MKKKNLIKSNNFIFFNPIIFTHLKTANLFQRRILESKSQLLIMTKKKMLLLLKAPLILRNQKINQEIFLESILKRTSLKYCKNLNIFS